MSLQFFGHPFSSYTQKVLIALWANEIPFEYRILEQDHPRPDQCHVLGHGCKNSIVSVSTIVMPVAQLAKALARWPSGE